jgi:hypothetical protein
MSMLGRRHIAALLIPFLVAGASGPAVFAQGGSSGKPPSGTKPQKDTKDSSAKPQKDKDSKPEKDKDSKPTAKPPPASKPAAKANERTPVNCVIYVQYSDAASKIFEAAGEASNKDLKASADAVAGKQQGGAEVAEVNAKVKFSSVLAKWNKKTNKCCKKIEILSHGNTDGSMLLPYENTGAGDLKQAQKDQLGADSLGGPKAKAKDPNGGPADPSQWLEKFVSQIKDALCPDPEDNSTRVVFDGCYTAKDGGINEQVGAGAGVKTAGYTGTCDFGYIEKEDPGKPKEVVYPGPRPKEGTSSQYKEFDPKVKDEGTMLIPPGREGFGTQSGEYVAYTVPVANDGGGWCSYGDGRATATAVTLTDENGVPVASAPSKPLASIAERAPVQANNVPTASDTPPTPPAAPPTTERPPTSASAPPAAPTTPDAPTTVTDAPPRDVPPQIPDTVFVKASEAVLTGGQTGRELQNQTVKLVFAKPDLPGGGASKTAQDTGFDRDPAQCTTGAGGECKIDVHPDDRPLYGLASSGAKPNRYRLDLNLLKHSGAVAETTGKAKPDLPNASLAGAKLAAGEFKIGNRTFTRLEVDEPYGRGDNSTAYSRALGPNAETDYCRSKKPGPLGLEPTSLSALNHELPEAMLKLDRLARAGRSVR